MREIDLKENVEIFDRTDLREMEFDDLSKKELRSFKNDVVTQRIALRMLCYGYSDTEICMLLNLPPFYVRHLKRGVFSNEYF